MEIDSFKKMINYNKDGKTDADKYKEAEAGIYKPITAKNAENSAIYICPTVSTCATTTLLSSDFKVGYFKIGGKYYSCPSTDSDGTLETPGQLCKLIEPTAACGEGTVGQLVKKSSSVYELCLAKYVNGETPIFPTLGFLASGTDGKTYFVKHYVKGTSEDGDTYSVFNYNIGANYYALKREYSAASGDTPEVSKIILKTGYTQASEDVMVCAKAATSEAIDRFEDFCDTGAGRYFKCNAGICDSRLQETWDIVESNGEKCTFSKTVETNTHQYTGNCKFIPQFITKL